MASAKDELAALKLLAAQRRGEDKIIIKNHTAATAHHCSIKEGIAALALLVSKGQDQHSIHVIFDKEEKKRKLENPNNSTRIVLNMRSPDAWRKFQTEKERFFDIAVDPHIAIDLLIRALHETSDEKIRGWMSEGEREEIDARADASLPDWMKP